VASFCNSNISPSGDLIYSKAPLTMRWCWSPSNSHGQYNPADRFLTATAQILDLTLVTADDSLLRLGTIRSMKNWSMIPSCENSCCRQELWGLRRNEM